MRNTLKHWRILDYGNVPEDTSRMIEYTCMNCDEDSLLPVVGSVMAQMGQGLVFDIGGHAIPAVIQCRHCRKRYSTQTSQQIEAIA